MSNLADHRRYLDAETLKRASSLEIRARQVVEGVLTGSHRSPYMGSSVEFAQHRQYSAGDDVRRVDWRVFGRSDRIFIKQFEEETNLPIMLIVDASESMAYTSDAKKEAWTKFDHATSLAATLAYLAHRQQDICGLAVFDRALARFLKPATGSTQWRTIVEELSRVPKREKTDTGKVLDQIAEQIAHRSLVFVISDFFDDLASIQRGLKHLRHRKHEVVVVQTLDRQEIEFDFDDVTLFKGMEALGDLLVEPAALRDAYRAQVKSATDGLAKACRSLGAEYHRVESGQPIDAQLRTILSAGAARQRAAR